MRYRRARLAGGTYFFTLVTAQRRPLLTGDQALLAMRQSLRTVKARHPFQLEALVVLPDHLHTLWTLPEGDADFSTRWMLIKSSISRALHHTGVAGPVWQARYWEHLIRDDADFAAHADYLHFNPVKHGLVASPGDWPWSSFSRWVAAGRYPADWGAGVELAPEIGGE